MKSTDAHRIWEIGDLIRDDREPGQTKGGSQLWQAMIEAKIARTRDMGCFVAGTLVHTKEGLKPIEQIKVGDLVLSRPESGEGEESYQPVTRTFQYEDREVYLFNFTAEGETKSEYIAVTGAHPIWVNSLCYLQDGNSERIVEQINAWMSVEELYLKHWRGYWFGLEDGNCLSFASTSLANGRKAVSISPQLILAGHKENEGVAFSDHEGWLEDCLGGRVLFDNHGVRTDGWTTLGGDPDDFYFQTENKAGPLEFPQRSGGHPLILRTVFNLEVANSKSYFVGNLGLWVHNTSGLQPSKPLPQRDTRNLGVFVGTDGKTRFAAELAGTLDRQVQR